MQINLLLKTNSLTESGAPGQPAPQGHRSQDSGGHLSPLQIHVEFTPCLKVSVFTETQGLEQKLMSEAFFVNIKSQKNATNGHPITDLSEEDHEHLRPTRDLHMNQTHTSPPQPHSLRFPTLIPYRAWTLSTGYPLHLALHFTTISNLLSGAVLWHSTARNASIPYGR